jgi:ParB family transcriptional regulator, chromosome partitioning protein
MLAPETVSAETIVESIVPEKLHDHPKNPPSRVVAEAITGLMQSIDSFGQRDPVRVRPLNNPIGHYQILSGHRRAAACRLLGRPVDCIVVYADDREALKEVMLGNAEREDLNPIERAELMQSMVDAGIDRLEVGRIFGLESESGVKNTLRLLKLPKSIRKRVESGDLPARAARALVPYADATLLLDNLAKNKESWQWRRLIESGKFEVRENELRPMDGKTKYSPGWDYVDAVRKFDVAALSESDRTRLQIVTLPIGKKGALVEVAQNTKLFDTLNEPHVKKKSSYGAASSKPAKKESSKLLTPAEAKAEEKRRAKEADERLAKRLPIWRRRFIRCTLATMAEPTNITILASLPWWLAQTGGESMSWILRAARTLGCSAPKDHNGSLAQCIASITDGKVEMIDRLWRVLVWPQRLAWRVGLISGTDAELTTELPVKMALDRDFDNIDDELAMQLELAKITMQMAWDQAAGKDAPQRQLFEEFLGLHTTSQLMKLAIDWKLNPFPGDKKAFLIATILNAHTSDATSSRRLPMPKCLEASKPKAKAKR